MPVDSLFLFHLPSGTCFLNWIVRTYCLALRICDTNRELLRHFFRGLLQNGTYCLCFVRHSRFLVPPLWYTTQKQDHNFFQTPDRLDRSDTCFLCWTEHRNCLSLRNDSTNTKPFRSLWVHLCQNDIWSLIDIRPRHDLQLMRFRSIQLHAKSRLVFRMHNLVQKQLTYLSPSIILLSGLIFLFLR